MRKKNNSAGNLLEAVEKPIFVQLQTKDRIGEISPLAFLNTFTNIEYLRDCNSVQKTMENMHLTPGTTITSINGDRYTIIDLKMVEKTTKSDEVVPTQFYVFTIEKES